MPNPYYPHLFAPIQVRGKTIKNRIVSAPHSCPYMFVPGDNGRFDYSDDAVAYYGNLARGGAAIVNTGHLCPDPRYYLGYNKVSFNFFTDMLRWHQTPQLRRMSTLIHAYGALASLELNHAGHFSTPVQEGFPVPGPCDCVLPNGRQVWGIDEAEMSEIADYYANAAQIAVDAGFDMINVHAGHNWLFGQFLSPIENKRTDQYGGNPVNRARFLKMVMQRIRDRVGEQVILKIRISATEMCEGGYDIDEAIESVQSLQDVIDIVQCSVGKFGFVNSDGVLAGGDSSPTANSPMRSEVFTFPTQYMDNGCNVYLAEKMKQNVNILVETVGGINDPALGEDILKNGQADLIGTARAFIADPNWAHKAELGRPEDIRPCIRCMRCMETNTFFCVGECTVNPRRILYNEYPKEFKDVQKRVAVVGGGPAGMEAALELGKKGHHVTLYEAGEQLGGQLSYADHVVFKGDVKRYRNYLITQVNKAEHVEVKLNTRITPELLKAEQYDAVVVAIGAPPRRPDIPGAELPHVKTAAEIFGKEDTLGNSVLIIGGGATGCETAIHLSYLGKAVYLTTRRDSMMKNETVKTIEAFSTRFYLDHDYEPHRRTILGVPESSRIHQLTHTRCLRIAEGEAVLEVNGEKQTIQVDQVIIAAGLEVDDAANRQFEDTAPEVLYIGDCNGGRDLRDTASDGYHAALRL